MNEHGFLFPVLRAAWQAGVVANEHRIVIALINAVWQSAVIALFSVAALRLSPRMSANARCAVWMLAFCVSATLPAVDFALVKSVSSASSQAVRPAAPPSDPRRVAPDAFVLVAVTDPAIAPRWTIASPTRRTPETAPLAAAGIAASVQRRGPAVMLLLARAVDRVGDLLFLAWLIGAAILGIRICLQLDALIRAKRSLTRTDFTDEFVHPLTRARSYVVGVSDRLEVPCLLGLFQPVIAIPRSLVRRLSAADLTRIVLHESAHVRRCDDWFNFFEQVVLAAAFFNPVLHYIVRCTNLEREIACDDEVTAPADRLRYAECLSVLASHARLGGTVMAPGLFGGRRQLLVRIEQLLDAKHCVSSALGRVSYVAMSLTMAIAVLLCQVGIPVLAAERNGATLSTRGTSPQPPRKIKTQTQPATRIAFVSVRVVAGQAVIKPQVSLTLERPTVRAPLKPKVLVLAPKAPTVRRSVSRTFHTKQGSTTVHQASVYRLYAENSAATIAFTQTKVSDVSAATALPRFASNRSVFVIYPKSANLNAAENSDLNRYLKALRAAGYTVITTHDASMLLDHDVSVTYARAMHDAGLGLGSAASALAKLRDHDVSAEYARSMKELLHSPADWKALPALSDHGVSASLAKAMGELSRAQALSQMNLRALGQLSDHGVSAAYLQEMARARYTAGRPCPDLTMREIAQLRDHDVDAAYIASLAAAGYSGLSVRDLTRLRDHGVSADFILRARRAHHNALLSVDELIHSYDRGTVDN